MRASKFNDEVLFTADDIAKVDAKDIEELKQKARLNPRRRVRLCVHKDLDDSIHEMLIVHEKSCYIQPHKHIGKTESFHIIEGLVDIILFDEDGQINGIIPMGDYSTGLKFFYRLPPSHYHTLLIQSDVLVFHEITNGPFKSEDTVWASWAPEENDVDEVSRYTELIVSSIEENSKYE
ncbi:WbuC family cupin fold metalloprotein [candidate division KSB1 bacterium]|nr:WbuC family cupin fold metalloprotein [candidate division KSB1 bacterium]